jgi:exosome complex exonuclease DIS3/RRP44
VQRRIDMLPKPLTEDICSLRCDVDRLAFSVVWEINPVNGEARSSTFTKSIIRSRAALTYAEAQTRIDDARLTDELTENLRALNNLAKVLRKNRADQGALQLASPEVKFEIDTETHDPLDVGMYQVSQYQHFNCFNCSLPNRFA